VVSRLRGRKTLAGVAGAVVVAVVLSQVLPMVWPRPGTDEADELAGGGGATLALTAVTVNVDAAPVATVSPTSRQSVVVRRGSISEQLVLSGRVAGLEEVPVSFPVHSRVGSLEVTPGQAVEAGQVLLKGDQKEIVKTVESARARVDAGSVRLAQAEAQAQARQREADRRQEADRTQRQLAIGQAEAGLRRALADYELVKAGAPASDRLTAAGAVNSARAAINRAEAELARLRQGPSENAVQAADQHVWQTRLAVQKAEAELERLRRGADPTDLRAAERDQSAAQTALLRAQADLERVSRPDPAAVSTAERDVQRAELAVRVADSSGGKDKNARQARDAAVRSARLNLQDAQERLARLRQGPPPADLEAARRAVADARTAVQIANERREAVAKGPDELTLSLANQAVEAAKLAAAEAEARYLDLKAGPPADQLNAAQGGLESAQASLGSAIMRQNEVNSHPTRAELQEAEEKVGVNQAAVDRAYADAEVSAAVPDDDVDPASYDLVLLRKDVEQDRATLDNLERDLAATRLLAPTAGVVTSILVRPGDPLEPGRPVMTVAKPGDPVVRVDLSDRDVARLTPGQAATVLVDGAAAGNLDASVDQIETPQGALPTGRFRVTWPQPVPSFGSTAQVMVTLQRKDDVLIVPQRAIRAAGQRRFVEILEAAGRRNVDVQVGISQGGDTEIVSGLAAGQVVIIGQ
jgi:RND family efflux transporter MFP subunit